MSIMMLIFGVIMAFVVIMAILGSVAAVELIVWLLGFLGNIGGFLIFAALVGVIIWILRDEKII